MTQTPKQCRSGRRCEPQTRKEAIDCLAHHSELSLPQMCERAGLDYNRMAKSCSLHEKRVPHFDEVALLTINSARDQQDRNLVAVKFLNFELGGLFVAMPSSDATGDEFFGAMTAATERLSAMGREIHEALRNDGEVDAAEETRILAKTHAMHEQIATIESMVKARRKSQQLKAVERSA